MFLHKPQQNGHGGRRGRGKDSPLMLTKPVAHEVPEKVSDRVDPSPV
ncbi:hypothetical protein AMTRI_Chr03g49490 [Amborella trichopoda]